MSEPFGVIACAIRPTKRKGVNSLKLNRKYISQELISAYPWYSWILQYWGEILHKTGEVTQNLQGSTEVSELTLPENSVFLRANLGALDLSLKS